jgi:hypothetical protein
MTTTLTEQRTAAPTRWSVDGAGSFVEFAVKTFWGLASVRGHFDRFDGWYETGPAWARSRDLDDRESPVVRNEQRPPRDDPSAGDAARQGAPEQMKGRHRVVIGGGLVAAKALRRVSHVPTV